ncbi:hypothetical protein GTP45_05830 [Pseudoduganella sp. FT55W]|uniref:Uncharacterized protein n=1 Tax=Duganella rivi TaxID=2666083 RepID=A0A7X4KAL3_9BURK|nr:hypothetical protein [Duganella rivi]MYM66354.1 hypothetical protein [Duganella rivi]
MAAIWHVDVFETWILFQRTSLMHTSTLRWLTLIFVVTLLFEVHSLILAGLSVALVFRVLFLALLFVLTINGQQWARILLAICYALGGIVALASLAAAMPLWAVVNLAIFGVFSLLASGYLFRSRVLRANTR